VVEEPQDQGDEEEDSENEVKTATPSTTEDLIS